MGTSCKECGYFVPTGNKWMCVNPKCKDGNFVRIVKPDDDYDSIFHCFERRKGGAE